MKISNTTAISDERYGITKSLKMHAEAGFEAVDFCMCGHSGKFVFEDGWHEAVIEMKRLADELGLALDQTHGPFPPYSTLNTPEGVSAYIEKAKRSLQVAGMLGAPCMVVHPVRLAKGTHEDQLKHNLEIYSPLLPLARELGVKIAIENMHAPRKDENGNTVKHVCLDPVEHKAYVDAFNDDHVVACLDIGHAVVAGYSPADFVRGLGDALFCLHVHDNDGISDMHTLPYSGKLDFAEFAKALSDIGYKGNISLEATNYEKNLPDVLFKDGLRIMARSASAIRDAFYKAQK